MLAEWTLRSKSAFTPPDTAQLAWQRRSERQAIDVRAILKYRPRLICVVVCLH